MYISPSLTAILALALVAWVPWLVKIAGFNKSLLEKRIFFASHMSAILSLCFSPGDYLGILAASIWLLWCAWNALRQTRAMLIWGHDHIGRLLTGIGSILLTGGAVWLVASRFEQLFMGFGEPWKTLTAIHFHFAGFLLPCLLGLQWDFIRTNAQPTVAKIYGIACGAYIISFILVAVGLNGMRSSELLGTQLLFTSVMTAGWILLRTHAAHTRGFNRFLILVIGVAGATSFTFALLYSWRVSTSISLITMIVTHGVLNSLVFIPLLLLFTARLKPILPERDILFSRLSAKWRVGAKFFEPLTVSASTPQGLLERFSEFNRSQFSTVFISDEVRHFYEQTSHYDLAVTAEPKPIFKLIWKEFIKPIFSSIEQLNLPDSEKNISGTIRALDAQKDGRRNPRGWVRTDRKTGKAIYAAAYAMHTTQNVTYMNIAFPLPLSNMTSVLHIELLKSKLGGLSLTTLRGDHAHGDQGVYLVLNGRGMRLPLDETIEVWFDGELKARHQMWLAGYNYLNLHYTIQLKS
jgi:hypothetical protein